MEGLTDRRRHKLLARGLLRACATAVVMVALYYVLPLDRRSDTAALFVELALGVALLSAVMIWQVRAILRSRYPGIRAVQSLAVITPLFLLFFASTYFMLSFDDAGMFTEPLTRSDAIYLTVTIFATVGFGDISAQTEIARLVVTVQMLLDLVVLGLGIQVILGAAKRGRADTNETGS